jgi:hypothetical protein
MILRSSIPDPEDIVTCSVYLVGYQMKCAQTLAIEKKNMKDLVMNMDDIMYGNKEGVFSDTRKILNAASGRQSKVFAGTATTEFVFRED